MTSRRSRTNGCHRQRGAALLLILLVILVAASASLVTQLGDRRGKIERLNTSRAALADAKQLLLDFAATYPDRYGGQPLQLPCPDIDPSAPFEAGESHTASCGARSVNVIGRFPWRTLGAPVPRDASGSCLWYAVSGSYKSAGTATAEMINPDSNGQLRLYSADDGALLEGAVPEERPVAILLAPMHALPGQARSGTGVPGQICSDDFGAADFLDSASGVSNASLSGVANAIDAFAVKSVGDLQHNDQVLTIHRRELARLVHDRSDFDARIRQLARGVASCIAAYGAHNPGGTNDRRLPWPAPVALSDYADASDYDDRDDGVYSGRLPDGVNDSSAVTGNPVARLLSDCNPAVATDWDPSLLAEWQHWKDHFFYAVAGAFQPSAGAPSACGDCLSVNGGGTFAAIVWYSGARLPTLAQRRDAPPLDPDTKQDILNYLEGRNATNHPYLGGPEDYESRVAAADFNDIAYCVDSSLAVDAC